MLKRSEKESVKAMIPCDCSKLYVYMTEWNWLKGSHMINGVLSSEWNRLLLHVFMLRICGTTCKLESDIVLCKACTYMYILNNTSMRVYVVSYRNHIYSNSLDWYRNILSEKYKLCLVTWIHMIHTHASGFHEALWWQNVCVADEKSPCKYRL